VLRIDYPIECVIAWDMKQQSLLSNVTAWRREVKIGNSVDSWVLLKSFLFLNGLEDRSIYKTCCQVPEKTLAVLVYLW
jgi:hypothetical protein